MVMIQVLHVTFVHLQSFLAACRLVVGIYELNNNIRKL